MPNPENLIGQGFHTDPSRINKSGRPKGTLNLSTILRAMLDEDVDVVIDGEKTRKQLKEVMIRKLIKKANDGDLRAIAEIWDRMEGKAIQAVDNRTVSEMEIRVIYDDDNKAETPPSRAAEDSQ